MILLIKLVIESKQVCIYGSMGSGTLPFFSRLTKLCPQYLYQASKSQYIIIFLIIKCFWKQKNKIYVKIILFCVCKIHFRSCNLVCVALEYCASAFKVRSFEMSLRCNKEFMFLLVFPLAETASKNGKKDGSCVN